MKITIVETGLVPESLRGQFDDYPAMFRDLLGDGFDYDTVSPIKGETLPDPAGMDGILITGSAAGVYDDEPWIAPLLTFIQDAAKAGVPQAGICFGHQAMAEALGGTVIKSPKGWGVGRHTYSVDIAPEWMTGVQAGDEVAIAVSHQDQVVTPPPGAEVIAATTFTPYAALSYAGAPAISFQCHPEFEDDYSAALYQSRQGRPLTQQEVAGAVASLKTPDDNARMGEWLGNFFRQSAS